MPEMEMAGNGHTNAVAGTTTTIKARVLDENGKVIADLGTIVGPRTKAEGRKTRKKLADLKDRRVKEEKKGKKKRLFGGMNNG